MSAAGNPDNPTIRDHRRQWRNCLYVYPVISRRSRGLSIGVNLNPDKDCTFRCVYCQIDRTVERGLKTVSLELLRRELDLALRVAKSGELWREQRFSKTPEPMRRINDIAFSGDGEPTCYGDFDKAVRIAAECKKRADLAEVKLVIITNASRLDSPQVRRALGILDANNGEIWAKLDAGTEQSFGRINRPQESITLRKIVRDITDVAQDRPIVIQTLMFRTGAKPPPSDQIDAYCERLGQIVRAGGKIKLVQLHTIARPPAESGISALSDEQLEAIAGRIRLAVPGIVVETYGGLDVPPQRRG